VPPGRLALPVGAEAPAAAMALDAGRFCHHQAAAPKATSPSAATQVCIFLKGILTL
jgi:hypothetical protein